MCQGQEMGSTGQTSDFVLFLDAHLRWSDKAN